MPEITLEWGHPVLAPDGCEIRLPDRAFTKLSLMGLLVKNRNRGMKQITEQVYEFMEPDYVSLMEGLRAMLGPDVSGVTTWLYCGCRPCQTKADAELQDLGITEADRNRSGFLPLLGKTF